MMLSKALKLLLSVMFSSSPTPTKELGKTLISFSFHVNQK